MLTIGTHMSIADGIVKTAQNVIEIGANTMQIFSRNPRGSGFKNYSQEEKEAFEEIRLQNHFGPLMAHAPYTMNLASNDERVYKFACTVLREDVKRMEELQMDMLVFHPGSHTGIGEEQGIRNIIKGIDQALTGKERIKILLETMSGKGTEIGRSFEELKRIRDGVQHPEQIGICLDTCHVFAAGYDIVNDPDSVFAEFDRVIGLDRLKAIHLNDSMNPLGSHKDRHARIGEGQIGLEALVRVINHPATEGIPFILETPNDDEGWTHEIALLRNEYKQK